MSKEVEEVSAVKRLGPMDILDELQTYHLGTRVGWALRASAEIVRLRKEAAEAQRIIGEFLDIFDPGDPHLNGWGPGEIDVILEARKFTSKTAGPHEQ